MSSDFLKRQIERSPIETMEKSHLLGLLDFGDADRLCPDHSKIVEVSILNRLDTLETKALVASTPQRVVEALASQPGGSELVIGPKGIVARNVSAAGLVAIVGILSFVALFGYLVADGFGVVPRPVSARKHSQAVVAAEVAAQTTALKEEVETMLRNAL